MEFPKLTALLTALQGGAAPTQEEYAAVNAELTTAGITLAAVYPVSMAKELSTAQTELTAAQTALVASDAKVGTLTTDLGVANTSLTAMTAENTVLKAKVAAAPATAAPAAAATDPSTSKTPEQISQEIINALPHNQGILTNPLFAK